MKRNEMIDIMYKWIDNNTRWVESCDYYDDYCPIDTYEVGLLLDIMVEAGMLPPYSGSDPWGSERCFAHELIWEEEDGSN